jgi:hypothetical protein|tara:strand:+ start:603 stop:1916 length:1314 start_codon:yes stop_codon:yes gene_type:complete
MGGSSKQKSVDKSVSGPSDIQSFYGNLSKMFTTQTPASMNIGGQLYNPQTQQFTQLEKRVPEREKMGQGSVEGFMQNKQLVDSMGIQRLADGTIFIPENTSEDQLASITQGLQAGTSDAELGITNFGGELLQKYGFDEMDYTSFYEAYDQGTLDSTTSGIVSRALEIANNPEGATEEQISQIYETAGANSAFALPDPPLLTDVVAQITNNLPPAQINFINSLLVDSTQESIDARVDEYAEALFTQLEDQGEEFIQSTMGNLVADLGGASSGAVLNVVKEGLIELTKDANAKVAGAKLQFLQTAIQARDTAASMIKDLLGIGQSQQALSLQKDMALLESEVTIQAAKIQAHLSLQQQLNTSLFNVLGLAQDEYRTSQQARINKQAAFLNMITTLATTGTGINQSDRTQTTSQPAFSVGLDLGMLALAGARYFGPAPTG